MTTSGRKHEKGGKRVMEVSLRRIAEGEPLIMCKLSGKPYYLPWSLVSINQVAEYILYTPSSPPPAQSTAMAMFQ